MPRKKKEIKQKSDEKYSALLYPNIPSHAKEETKNKKNKLVTRNFQLSCPSRPSHTKKRKRRKNNIVVTSNILTVIPEIGPSLPFFSCHFYNYPARSIVDKKE